MKNRSGRGREAISLPPPDGGGRGADNGARAELQASEAHLRRTLAAAHVGTWEWDVVTGANVWSDGLWDLYDLDRSVAPTHEAWLASVHPDDRAAVEAQVRAAVEHGAAVSVEWRVATRDGSLRRLSSRGSPEHDHTGRLVRYLGVCTDITQFKALEAEAHASRAELEAALESITDGVYISDADGDLVDFNEAFARLNRFSSKDECLRRYAEYADLFEVFLDTGELASAESWAVPRALRGEVAAGVLYGVRRKDTGERWVASYSFAPIRDGDGAIAGAVVVGRDVTAEVEARRALAESESRYRTLFESMPQGVVYQAADGHITAANPAAQRILGLTLDQLQGRTSADPRWRSVREDGSDFPGEEHPSMVALTTGEPVQDVVMGVYNPADDAYRWISVDAVPQFRPGDALPYQVYTTFDDITERREAEAEIARLNAGLESRVQARTAELQRAIEELEAFVYSASHDLRAPLRAIDGFSQMVVVGAGDRLTGTERADLQRVRAGAQRMGALIDDLMALSRASRKEMEVALVDVSSLARTIVGELREAQPERAVQAVVRPGMSAPADPSLLRLVLVNLLDNAWKFTSRRVTAHVEVGEVDGGRELRFFVKDDGAGFDTARADRLFTPFERLHGDDDFEGSGIGLAIVRRIVARHGGRVWAEAEPGRGATFWFSLPARPAQKDARAE